MASKSDDNSRWQRKFDANGFTNRPTSTFQSHRCAALRKRYAELTYDHAFVKVWTQNPDTSTVFTEEILVIRRENDGSLSFALSKGMSIEHPILALWRSQRYFVERTIQDTKSELEWNELQALKYRAYMHTLALCAMALVFMADIKIDQRKDYVKPHIVKEKLNIPQLPDLSLANVKELLKSIFPLQQLSKEQAV